ncbi:MAG TPA: hypothetical protein VFA60_10915 [Terriglobales bacterium]|nr:hypothetical protein [Terriglobales bacterium]
MIGRRALALLVALLLAAAAVAQGPPQPPPQPQPPAKPEHQIAPQEAKDLFRSVDSILKWVSADTNLPIKHSVKRKLSSRKDVEKFVSDRLKNDEDAQRLKNSELVLKKLGLLPRDFNLSRFLVELLGEQVAGFYDPKKKTVYLLNWIEPQQQRDVLAHELTHALQDQSVGLEKWQRAGEPPDRKPSKKKLEPEEERRQLQALVDSDEAGAARQAVAEGQGMAVLLDFQLRPQGKTVRDLPEFVNMVRAGIGLGGDSPVFQSAPRFLREVLTFAYNYGLGFTAALLARGGKDMAYAGALRNPPATSRHIMQPETYLDHETITPLLVPALDSLAGDGYVRFDVGTMGQFDTFLLLQQYAKDPVPRDLSPSWRGGYYYAAQKRNGNASPGGGSKADAMPASTAEVALFYVSRWSSPAAAQQFAGHYAAGLAKRYRSATPAHSGKENTLWNTDEGPVLIQVAGDVVIVAESFDAETTNRLRDGALALDAPAPTP